MPNCPSCNSEDLKPDYRFCPYCGYELGLPILCPKCGYDMSFDTFEMLDGAQGFFECFCLACNFQGRQWHKLGFDCLQELKDDGQYIDIQDT